MGFYDNGIQIERKKPAVKKTKSMQPRKNDSSAKEPQNSDNPTEPESKEDLFFISFRKEILDEMDNRKVATTPENYSIFFEKKLSRSSTDIRKRIEEETRQVYFDIDLKLNKNESSILRALKLIRELLLEIKKISNASSYTRDNLSKKLAHERASNDLAETLTKDINILSSFLIKKEGSLQEKAKEIESIVLDIRDNSDRNIQYGVYNQSFMKRKIEEEIKLVLKHSYDSSFILLDIDKHLLQSGLLEKNRLLYARKAIAKTLLKAVRKSDAVFHYKDSMFGVLLPHTCIKEAEDVSIRISDFIANSGLFVNKEMTKHIRVAMGVVPIFDNNSVDEILAFGLRGIEESYKDKYVDYFIYIGHCKLKNKEK